MLVLPLASNSVILPTKTPYRHARVWNLPILSYNFRIGVSEFSKLWKSWSLAMWDAIVSRLAPTEWTLTSRKVGPNWRHSLPNSSKVVWFKMTVPQKRTRRSQRQMIRRTRRRLHLPRSRLWVNRTRQLSSQLLIMSSTSRTRLPTLHQIPLISSRASKRRFKTNFRRAFKIRLVQCSSNSSLKSRLRLLRKTNRLLTLRRKV